MKRRTVVVAIVAGLTLLLAAPASAHPLGNFSVNQSTSVVVAPDLVTVTYVLDLAEIPTVEDRLEDATSECTRVAGELAVTIDGAPVDLRVATSSLTFPKGQAGLDTTRLTCRLTAPAVVGDATAITVRSDRYADRIGWREITAAGDRTTLETSLRSTSITDQLRRYPREVLGHPLDERTAELVARPGGPPLRTTTVDAPATTEARGVDGITASFTRFVGRHDLGVGVGAIAVVLAVLLGAVHAFAPGHGKTVMAAYLVGRHGSLRQASLVALTVTATHTTGVLLLGVLVSSSALVAPERPYPWLGATSGAMLVAIGITMLRAARARRAAAHAHAEAHAHAHGHEHQHAHDHAPEAHSHGGRWHTHAPPDRMDRTGLLAMGFVGGLLPSPSALVVLLGAIALGRAWFGIVLVVAYGAGIALTLTTVGLVLVRGREVISRRLPRLLALEAAMPVLTGAVVLLVGSLLAYRGIVAI